MAAASIDIDLDSTVKPPGEEFSISGGVTYPVEQIGAHVLLERRRKSDDALLETIVSGSWDFEAGVQLAWTYMTLPGGPGDTDAFTPEVGPHEGYLVAQVFPADDPSAIQTSGKVGYSVMNVAANLANVYVSDYDGFYQGAFQRGESAYFDCELRFDGSLDDADVTLALYEKDTGEISEIFSGTFSFVANTNYDILDVMGLEDYPSFLFGESALISDNYYVDLSISHARLRNGVLEITNGLALRAAAEGHTASEVIESAGGNVHLPSADQVEESVMFGPESATEGTLVAGGGLDVELELSSQTPVSGSSVSVSGGLLSDVDGAFSIVLSRREEADDSIIENLLETEKSLSAGVRMTWAEMSGGDVSFQASTPRGEYLQVETSPDGESWTYAKRFEYQVMPGRFKSRGTVSVLKTGISRR